jgi:hypothetical protein
VFLLPLPPDKYALAISPGPSVNVLASRPEISRTGDGPEEELMFVINEHLTLRKIAEKLSEPDTRIDEWIKVRNEL